MAEAKSISDINKSGVKNNLYILITQDTVFAATSRMDMESHLLSNSKFEREMITGILEGTCKLIYGLVLNPRELPFEIPPDVLKSRVIWLIKEVTDSYISLENFDSLQDVIQVVEDYVEISGDINIDSRINIILGQDIGFGITPSKTGDYINPTRVFC